jgi:hypothetical protein
MSPILLKKADLTMELWQEDHLESLFSASCLEKRFNIDKVRLIKQYPLAAAIPHTGGILEFLAFCLHPCHTSKATLLQDQSHSLGSSCTIIVRATWKHSSQQNRNNEMRRMMKKKVGVLSSVCACEVVILREQAEGYQLVSPVYIHLY